jgi:hypothetical protein
MSMGLFHVTSIRPPAYPLSILLLSYIVVLSGLAGAHPWSRDTITLTWLPSSQLLSNISMFWNDCLLISTGNPSVYDLVANLTPPSIVYLIYS